MKVILYLCFILLASGCGIAKETSKGLEEIRSSLKRANEKQELLRARERVKRSKSKYNKCLGSSSDRKPHCEDLRLEYEQMAEEYIKLQQQ